MYLQGVPTSELVVKFELSHRRRVSDWVRKVREGGYEALKIQTGAKSKGKSKKGQLSLEEKYERLLLEVEYLKKLLDLKRG